LHIICLHCVAALTFTRSYKFPLMPEKLNAVVPTSRQQAALEFLRSITQDEIPKVPVELKTQEEEDDFIDSEIPKRFEPTSVLLMATKNTAYEFTTPKGSAIAMFSIIPYKDKDVRKETKRQRRIYSMTPYL
jgi:hypothetical protein